MTKYYVELDKSNPALIAFHYLMELFLNLRLKIPKKDLIIIDQRWICTDFNQ